MKHKPQPPNQLNIALLILTSLANGFLLWWVSHSTDWYLIVIGMIGFALISNTLFSLLHEAVHGLLNSKPVVNEWFGRLVAGWFPTSLTIQRAFHLTHHKNNRSAEEQFDVLHEDDVKWLKYLQWYSIISGVYWFSTIIGLLLYLLVPSVFRIKIFESKDSKIAQQTSSSAYFKVFNTIDSVQVKLEILGSILFQALLFWLLDLSWWGWLLCYTSFAVYWSALQYADHAYSELDPINGAWNLSVSRITRAIYLNYHYHLAHHQNPDVPWLYLGDYVDDALPQPSFWKVWLTMWWKGPRTEAELARVSNSIIK